MATRWRRSKILKNANLNYARIANFGQVIVLWTAQNKWQPGWVASQQDVLAEDWIILKGSDE